MILLKLKSKEELIEQFNEAGYTEDEDGSYDNNFAVQMFDVCGKFLKADKSDDSALFDYFISIGNETFGVLDDWCEDMNNSDLITELVKSELINNPDYKENISDILDIYFRDNPDALNSWLNWFIGKN